MIEIATKRIQKLGNAALRLSVQPLFIREMLHFSNSAGLFHRTPYYPRAHNGPPVEMNTDASSLSLLSAGPLVLFTEEKEQKKGSQKQTQQLRQ